MGKTRNLGFVNLIQLKFQKMYKKLGASKALTDHWIGRLP